MKVGQRRQDSSGALQGRRGPGTVESPSPDAGPAARQNL